MGRKKANNLEWPYSLLVEVFTPGSADVQAVRQEDWPKDICETVEAVIQKLSEREQRALRLRFGEKLTLEKVGMEMEVTRERARQLITKALRRLRHPKHANLLADGLERTAELQEEGHRKALALEAARSRKIEELQRSIGVPNAEALIRMKDEKGSDSIKHLQLGVRAFNVLMGGGILTAEALCGHSLGDLMALAGMGKKSLDDIKHCMKQNGFTLRQPICQQGEIDVKKQKERPGMPPHFLCRGRAVDDGRWIEGFHVSANSYDYYDYMTRTRSFIFPPSQSSDPGKVDAEKMIEVFVFTIGHCTGVPSADGRMIFDGDIVGGRDGVGYIKFQQGGYWLIQGGTATNLSEFSPNELAIVGNVHETPEKVGFDEH